MHFNLYKLQIMVKMRISELNHEWWILRSNVDSKLLFLFDWFLTLHNNIKTIRDTFIQQRRYWEKNVCIYIVLFLSSEFICLDFYDLEKGDFLPFIREIYTLNGILLRQGKADGFSQFHVSSHTIIHRIMMKWNRIFDKHVP